VVDWTCVLCAVPVYLQFFQYQMILKIILFGKRVISMRGTWL